MNDSITVSSTWELTPVGTRYSYGDGVHTPLVLVKLLCLRSVCSCVSSGVSVLCVEYPRHGYVLYG